MERPGGGTPDGIDQRVLPIRACRTLAADRLGTFATYGNGTGAVESDVDLMVGVD